MKKIILLLMFTISVGVLAETVSGYQYETKKVKGKYYTRKGSKLYTGPVKMYYENERQHIEVRTKEKDMNIYSHLTLSALINVKDGVENGEYFGYFRNGKIKEKGTYVDGKIEGTVTQYYENGNLYTTVNVEKGKKEGKEISYYDNKQEKEVSNYKNGLLEGKYEHFAKNGKKLEKGSYKEGKLEGKVYIYDENGKLDKTLEYKDGVEVK